ncbi:hypothetical protein PBSP11A_000348400 [Plasmodium berghei]|uniref:Uncharacterized protein n=1 Tax=Plasmodium berghei TaxID=5821 RepID=A0A1C6YR88_PLABE|nr:hypothetical protein PBNK65NY_000347800 [Plasmodium berghei]SCO63913.1 hypothetical protein PBSP11A_000348400 [Plasmodium berghei]
MQKSQEDQKMTIQKKLSLDLKLKHQKNLHRHQIQNQKKQTKKMNKIKTNKMKKKIPIENKNTWVSIQL